MDSISLDFDGVDDIITGPSITVGDVFTYFAWIRPDTLGENSAGFISTHGPFELVGDTRAILLLRTTNAFRFAAGRSTQFGEWAAPTDSIVLGVWQSVAATYDISVATNDPLLYVNGVSQTVTEITTPSGTAPTEPRTLYVGDRPISARAFDGKIGEVAVWNRILTAAEIAAVHWLGWLAGPAIPFLYWPLDHSDVATTARDFSGNGRDGTTTGAVLAENPPAGRPPAVMVA